MSTVERQYGVDFGVRGDMKLRTLMNRDGVDSLGELVDRARSQRRPQAVGPGGKRAAAMAYLDDVLRAYAPTEPQVNGLRSLRAELEDRLRSGWTAGQPRIYYGGSYAKGTMVSLAYDLDIVLYFPASVSFTARAFYEAVEDRLRGYSYAVRRKNVALRLPYQRGLHVDVVPAKTSSTHAGFAHLYSSDADTTKQTSIETHVATVKASGRRDVIRLAKIWKIRQGIDLGSFVLELAVMDALNGSRAALDTQFLRVLEYLRDHFERARLVDPANTNNVVSTDLTPAQKRAVAQAAGRTRAAQQWKDIVW